MQLCIVLMTQLSFSLWNCPLGKCALTVGETSIYGKQDTPATAGTSLALALDELFFEHRRTSLALAVVSRSHEVFLLVEVLVGNSEHISDKVVKAGDLECSSCCSLMQSPQ